MRYTTPRKTKQKYNTICVGHHYAQPHITNVNKTLLFLLLLHSLYVEHYLILRLLNALSKKN
jgi:hypothetical protein